MNLSWRVSMKIFLKKFIQVIICIIMIPILLMVNVILHMAINMGISTLASKKVSDYSIEEHAERLRKRLDKRIPELEDIFDFHVDSYELLPAYGENSELSYFIVEFEPIGFLVVELLDEKGKYESIIPRSMYYHSDVVLEWSPYYYDSNNKNEKIYFRDELGEIITYNHSPFYMKQIQTQKSYLFEYSGSEYVFCINIDGYLINQITETKIEFENGKKILNRESAIYIGYMWAEFLY